MILTGKEIARQVEEGRIIIEPFDASTVTTNSYDIHLSDTVLVYEDEILDPKVKPKTKEIKIPEEGMILNQHDFVLGASHERVGSNFFAPMLHAKSGTARQGLFVHVTSDLVNIGSIGQLTLQLYATLPVKIYPGMRIAQVTFWVPEGEIELYEGKYQNAKGPGFSKNYEEFND
ncbi:MAG: dCTP deaminase [Rickettsiales bacterium]|nr:dCTP deaminase [Rickettsiales bacterium]